ncbi:MAG: ABC transporter permease [Conexivisphaerales archaeon]
MNLATYVARRITLSFFVIIGVLIITFYLSHILPGNPAILFAGSNPTPQEIAKIRASLGLDKPLYIQFLIYLDNVFHGNLGESVALQSPVDQLLAEALPNSVVLAVLATALAALIGVPLGILASRSRNGKLDNFLRIFSMSIVALPYFWLALLLQLIFADYLHLLPVAAYGGSLFFISEHNIPTITGSYLVDALLSGKFAVAGQIFWSMILPIISLAAFPAGVLIRQTRGAMLGVINQDFIRTAKAYGIPPREIETKYALRNALPPILVTLALTFAGALVGSVFVEYVFFLEPGLGFLIFQATGVASTSTSLSGAPDYALIQGVTIVITIAYVVMNFLADMIQMLIDRRIKL